MRRLLIEGRIWILEDNQGGLIEDIDTDQIYHNAYLHITDRKEMGKYALSNLKGWEDFPKKAKPGDVLVAGRNFGAGSSRQQAVDCFLALKIGGIIAPSFGAIYFRNAVNSAFPLIRWPKIVSFVQEGDIRSGDRLAMELSSGRGIVMDKKKVFSFSPLSGVQLDILESGGLFQYGKQLAGNYQ